MSKPSLTNCPKLAAAPAARGVPAQSWYNERCMNEDVPLQQELQPLLLARKYLQVQLVLSKRYSGGYSVGDHLFPFRTEKLSPTAPMVLRKRESRSPPSYFQVEALPAILLGGLFVSLYHDNAALFRRANAALFRRVVPLFRRVAALLRRVCDSSFCCRK